MKKTAVFCIPAHGHTNPMLPVVRELVRRGDEVRFYSFSEFQEKIERTGAVFVCCDQYLPGLSAREEENLKKVSATEMSIQDIRITAAMDEFLHNEFIAFKPDVVFTDSVCFWGKLNAWKYDVPMVVSTSTFAFNQMSSTYMKNSPGEMAGLIFGLPKVSRELNKLKAYGYKIKGLFSLIQSDNQTDSVVYTSKQFQPYSESFSDHYIFVGPSLMTDQLPDKNHERPLVYISLGTVINDRPDFYAKCIEAFRDDNLDVIISCGKTVDIAGLGELPENIKVIDYVDQLDVLSRADVFITHCGMNSVSESLYMAAPMVLFPQTNEQEAVARRVREIGAGMNLKDDSAAGIRDAVKEILNTPSYKKAAQECSDDFRSCPGAEGAADFIEGAPHSSDGVDLIRDLGKANVILQVGYSIAAVILGNILFRFIDIKYLWIYIILSIVLSAPVNKLLQKAAYKRLVSKNRNRK
ncbi:MAG: glycosyl transferase [Lachnospiraceae bacterium]|nr:glycosyl transferase [Lachnospiraceae bacterium]